MVKKLYIYMGEDVEKVEKHKFGARHNYSNYSGSGD
jgi:hypothetical protein